MDGAVVPGPKRRVFRRVEEKLRIVKLALEPAVSVAAIALANGVNANQVFRWKRQYKRDELKPRGSKRDTALVPVTIRPRGTHQGRRVWITVMLLRRLCRHGMA